MCSARVDVGRVDHGYQKQETPELEAIIQRHRIPVIWTNARREADCIYPDDESAFFGATQTLLELGHRHITYINNGSTEHYSRQARQSGYQRAMQAAGLTTEVLQGLSDYPFEPDIQPIRSLCSRPASRRPSAVLCYAPGDA